MASLLLTETTPLVANGQNDVAAPEAHNKSSVANTMINLMKTMMGTGILALPYACQQGGLVLYSFGMIAIGAWNVFCVSRLVKCLDLLPTDNNADGTSSSSSLHAGISTFAKVAWYSYGDLGLHLVDGMMILLLIGIVVAYVAAVMSFMADTPLSINPNVDAILTGLAMVSLSLVPNLDYLTRASSIGLLVLLMAFVVITGYGVHDRYWPAPAPTADQQDVSLKIWAGSWANVSHWFGIVVFGYGIVPLTYNFHESMREPHRLEEVMALAVTSVALLYLLLGVGLYLLFPMLESDILHLMPSDRDAWIPLGTRVGLSATIIATAPLLIVPCSQIIEGRILSRNRPSLLVRLGVVFTCVLIAVVVPGFVRVVSLVGCLCVAVVSFCLPPVFHWRLSLLYGNDKHTTTRWVDLLLLAWGIVATIVSTFYTMTS
jgi:solute carrier family 36 (proton-coupled amino acid transporter)